MTLAKIREQWEPGLKEILVVVDPDRNVIVLLIDDTNDYYVHRYYYVNQNFEYEKDWQISIDWNDNIALDSPVDDLREALDFITERFKEYIPK